MLEGRHGRKRTAASGVEERKMQEEKAGSRDRNFPLLFSRAVSVRRTGVKTWGSRGTGAFHFQFERDFILLPPSAIPTLHIHSLSFSLSLSLSLSRLFLADGAKPSIGATVAKVGGLSLVVGLAIFAVVSTDTGREAYSDVMTRLQLGQAAAPNVKAATAARMAASTAFAEKKKLALTAADAATAAENAADSAEAKAKSARDFAILARTQALNARVDKARASEVRGACVRAGGGFVISLRD